MGTSALVHFVNGKPLVPPFPDGTRQAYFAMGCFWGAERLFWQLPGVHVTSVGYAGGSVESPHYKLVCGGRTGHAETVHVVYWPEKIAYDELLRVFWEHHDPTQGNRQGNDVGTQYRSAIYTTDDAQQAAAEASRDSYGKALAGRGYPRITTEILPAPRYWLAEDYHQQYLAKNPDGYCGIGGCGVAFKPAESQVGEKA
jgi:peptide-methionine (S)-S-oxide reductase